MEELLLQTLNYRITKSEFGRFRGLIKRYGKSTVETSIRMIKDNNVKIDYTKLLGLIEYYCQRNLPDGEIKELEQYL